MKGPSAQDTHRRAGEVEIQRYTSWPGRSEIGRSRITIICPFCQARVVAYLWSLAGGGKRCLCGAFLASTGNASHWISR